MDSWYAIQGIIENLRKWEDEGWMKVQNADIFQKIAYELDTRGGETHFQWVKGHSNNPGNDGADKKASEGAQKENTDNIELKVPKEYQLQGARLAIMTQKLAYDWITQLKELKPITKRGQENIKDTMDALEDSGSPRPTEQKLWKDLKYSKIRKKHRRLVLETNP